MYALVAASALAPPLLRERGVERVAALSINGESLLARSCRCLIEGAGCDRVYVVAPPELPLPQLPGLERVLPTGNIVSDSLGCIARDSSSEFIIVSGSDMPLLTPEAVAAVLRAGIDSGADMLYPVCSREKIEERFPGTSRTYLRTSGATVSGGNMFFLRRSWFLSREDFFRRAFDLRKNKLALAGMVGFPLLLRVATGTASLSWIENYVGRRIGGRLRCSVIDFPELAVDLDKPEDLELFSAELDPRGGA